jgi:hypothetical protein
MFESRQRMANVLLKIIVASVVVGAVILYFMWRQTAAAPQTPTADAPVSSDGAQTRGATRQVPWIPASDRL